MISQSPKTKKKKRDRRKKKILSNEAKLRVPLYFLVQMDSHFSANQLLRKIADFSTVTSLMLSELLLLMKVFLEIVNQQEEVLVSLEIRKRNNLKVETYLGQEVLSRKKDLVFLEGRQLIKEASFLSRSRKLKAQDSLQTLSSLKLEGSLEIKKALKTLSRSLSSGIKKLIPVFSVPSLSLIPRIVVKVLAKVLILARKKRKPNQLSTVLLNSPLVFLKTPNLPKVLCSLPLILYSLNSQLSKKKIKKSPKMTMRTKSLWLK